MQPESARDVFSLEHFAPTSWVRSVRTRPPCARLLVPFWGELPNLFGPKRRLSTSAIRTTSGHVYGRLSSTGMDRNPFPLLVATFRACGRERRRPSSVMIPARVALTPVSLCVRRVCRHEYDANLATPSGLDSRRPKDRVKDERARFAHPQDPPWHLPSTRRRRCRVLPGLEDHATCETNLRSVVFDASREGSSVPDEPECFPPFAQMRSLAFALDLPLSCSRCSLASALQGT